MATSFVLQPGRELVVCDGGPMSGWWFYAEGFAARQESCRRVSTPFSPHEAATALRYKRSGQRRLHPVAHVPGEILHYRPPTAAPTSA